MSLFTGVDNDGTCIDIQRQDCDSRAITLRSIDMTLRLSPFKRLEDGFYGFDSDAKRNHIDIKEVDLNDIDQRVSHTKSRLAKARVTVNFLNKDYAKNNITKDPMLIDYKYFVHGLHIECSKSKKNLPNCIIEYMISKNCNLVESLVLPANTILRQGILNKQTPLSSFLKDPFFDKHLISEIDQFSFDASSLTLRDVLHICNNFPLDREHDDLKDKLLYHDCLMLINNIVSWISFFDIK